MPSWCVVNAAVVYKPCSREQQDATITNIMSEGVDNAVINLRLSDGTETSSSVDELLSAASLVFVDRGAAPVSAPGGAAAAVVGPPSPKPPSPSRRRQEVTPESEKGPTRFNNLDGDVRKQLFNGDDDDGDETDDASEWETCDDDDDDDDGDDDDDDANDTGGVAAAAAAAVDIGVPVGVHAASNIYGTAFAADEDEELERLEDQEDSQEEDLVEVDELDQWANDLISHIATSAAVRAIDAGINNERDALARGLALKVQARIRLAGAQWQAMREDSVSAKAASARARAAAKREHRRRVRKVPRANRGGAATASWATASAPFFGGRVDQSTAQSAGEKGTNEEEDEEDVDEGDDDNDNFPGASGARGGGRSDLGQRRKRQSVNVLEER